jgi:hypothetical protein
MMKLLIRATVASCLVGQIPVAEGRSLYDGSWDLVFVTQSGTCDPSYYFSVKSTMKSSRIRIRCGSEVTSRAPAR